MVALGTWLHTVVCGKLVGEDEFGNRYFEARRAPKTGRRKRWVVYKGMPEASKVPPAWHGWLHYTHAHPLSVQEAQRYPWQKAHLPNLTGTPYAYVPPGHLRRGGERDRTTADYEPWQP